MKLSKSLSIAAVAIAAACATNAFAQRDAALPKATPEVTTPKARADVKADTAQAKKKGQLNQNANANPSGDMATAGEKKTRPEVKSETAAARNANGGSLKTPKE